MAPNRPSWGQVGPSWPKLDPSSHQDGPRWPQVDPNLAKVNPKLVQVDPKWTSTLHEGRLSGKHTKTNEKIMIFTFIVPSLEAKWGA